MTYAQAKTNQVTNQDPSALIIGRFLFKGEQMNLNPTNIKNIAMSIRHKTHDYYWWKHNKSDEQINKINNTQVIAVEDLAEILAREFAAVDSEFNKEALIKTLTTNWSHL